MGARLLRIFARSQGLFFQRRPRSRRSSNEVAPSAGGGGGARDRRSRFSSSSPVLRVASVRKGEPPRLERFKGKRLILPERVGSAKASRLSSSRSTAALRAARASATPGGATQLVGARCVPRWRRLAFSPPSGPVRAPSGTGKTKDAGGAFRIEKETYTGDIQ